MRGSTDLDMVQGKGVCILHNKYSEQQANMHSRMCFLLGTGRRQASIYSGLEPAAKCRIKEGVRHVCFFSWLCCGCSSKGKGRLYLSLPITERIYASIASCVSSFKFLIGIKHFSPQSHLIWIMMTKCAKLFFCYWYIYINYCRCSFMTEIKSFSSLCSPQENMW